MANNTSQHILSTSANLLGFCLFVVSSFHFSNHAQVSLIDELTAIVAFLLALSCLLSFFSIRTTNPRAEQGLETTADYLFIASLAGIIVILLLITFNFIK
jgi:uncharacterized membrane protein